MAHEKLRPQYVFDETKIEQLKQIAPECFEDGKINFETLKQNLNDWTQNEEDPELEHFGLFWPGKRNARKAATLPPEGTLEPVWGDGLKADGTPDKDGTNDSKNIFIEGENLEVLKLLQKSYTGKIKMIYIDPPYNTGNDFVYDDDFTEPLQEYLRRTGQVDEEGKALTTNKRSDGRFHSKWLSMIYPRLRLARNLLTNDGVIFVSIDDNEVNNLKIILNEIFGEENFIAQIMPIVNPGGRDYKDIAITHEYLLVYGKSEATELSEVEKEVKFALHDSKGGFEYRELRNRNPKFTSQNRPNLFYPFFVNPKSKDKNGYCLTSLEKTKEFSIEVRPYNSKNEESVWRWGKPKAAENIDEVDADKTQLLAKEKSDGNWNVYEKNRKSTTKLKSIWDGSIYRTENGTRRIRELFDYTPFDHPKPIDLIRQCIEISVQENDIIMDFFAGSGSTGDALYKYVSEKDLNVNYILIQSGEKTSEESVAKKNNLDRISEITKERLRLASKSYNLVKDKGFSCFKLWNSNYKNWKNYDGISISELELKLNLFNENPLQDNYTKDGLLVEIILLEGFTLCSDITTLNEIVNNSIWKIKSEYCLHSLLVCLDEKIKKDTIVNLQLGDDDIFICLDSAISTEDKLRLSDKGLIKTI